MIIIPANTLSGGYEVANSVRFNDGDSPRLVIANPTAGTRTKGTFSTWFKRSTLGTAQYLFSTWNNSTSGYSSAMISFQTDDRLNVSNYVASNASGHSALITERVFRDVSAWYHVVVNWDTTDSETDRYKIYVNGTRETVFNGTPAYPTSSEDLFFNAGGTSNPQHIGFESVGSDQKYFDGYLAETVHIEGNDLTASSFGEFDEDSPTIWKPKDVSGLTFGDEGFYLDYEDSGDLGDDESGNTNDFAETNLAAADQATDTPTNNFCTFNPLIAPAKRLVLSEGNTVATYNGAYWATAAGTFSVNKGKWYWECKMSVVGHNLNHGVLAESVNLATANPMNQTGYTGFYNYDGGEIRKDNVVTTQDYGTFDNSEVIGIALNMDDKQISIYKDGSAIVSNYALSSTITGEAFPITVAYNTNSPVSNYNFGGCSGFTISSAANDENGYGNFEHTPPSGYYSLCTKNLAEFG